jgi:hypothetical protein
MREVDKLIKYLESDHSIKSVMNISEMIDKKLPQDEQNQQKALIMLSKDENISMFYAEDEETIRFAKQKIEDQDKPIGTLIFVVCEISGTSAVGERIRELESFIRTLNENSDWKFESKGSDMVFTISVRIESVDTQIIDEKTEIIQHFIDLLAFYKNIGIVIHSIQKQFVRKDGLLTMYGITQRALDGVSKEFISRVYSYVCLGNKEVYDAAHGLNRSYVENNLPNRISTLWATIETLFTSKTEHLLNNDEIEVIINCIDQLDIWKSEQDKIRLKKLKERIKDPNVLSLKNRNERIASSISYELDRDYNETLKMIKFVSKIRGKYLHELRKDEQIELRNTEEYLQEILKAYINKNLLIKS